jgi:hypothetical protein
MGISSALLATVSWVGSGAGAVYLGEYHTLQADLIAVMLTRCCVYCSILGVNERRNGHFSGMAFILCLLLNALRMKDAVA